MGLQTKDLSESISCKQSRPADQSASPGTNFLLESETTGVLAIREESVESGGGGQLESVLL